MKKKISCYLGTSLTRVNDIRVLNILSEQVLNRLVYEHAYENFNI